MTDALAPAARPSSPDGAPARAPRRRRRAVVQALGFLVGIVLLAWCASVAFGGPREAELRRLLHAPAWQVGALLALAALSAAINGVGFWSVLRPLHRLRLADVVAVNFVSSFLAFLPFKLGAVFRVGVHHKRDGVPMRDIIAWLAAFAALSLATLLPMAGAMLWRKQPDLVWVLASLAGAAACIGLGVVLARLTRTNKWLRHASLGSWRIVGSPWPGVWCGACKALDTFVHAARFLLAAYIFGIGLPPDRALVYAAMYYLLGAASPAGMLGVREAGIVILGLGEQREQLAQLVLTLSATEALTYAATCLPALAWLRRAPLPRVMSVGGSVGGSGGAPITPAASPASR